ncbi:TPA: hypothetical protein ACH3X1_013962 [Trebouxia sp. C0004]
MEELELRDSKLDTQSMAALSRGSWLQLKTLTLAGHRVHAPGIQYLAGAQWPQLEAINLTDACLDGSAMVMLLSCRWPCLQTLGLNQNYLHYIEELPETSQCLITQAPAPGYYQSGPLQPPAAQQAEVVAIGDN